MLCVSGSPNCIYPMRSQLHTLQFCHLWEFSGNSCTWGDLPVRNLMVLDSTLRKSQETEYT